MATGQTLNDRLNAARYAIAGQGLARVVCKATTEEIIGPKKKHLDYLLQCTHEPNVSIPQMANLLIERTSHNSWVVVFKALVTVHHLMCYGNERFTQYLASSNCNFQLNNFLDKAGPKAYDMSTYIRRYSKYINEKALSYRTLAFDFAKMKRGKEDGSLRSMPTDKLLKTIPTLQNQIDSLLEFDCNANDLTNGVINAAFMLLFRDLIRLFACYNDGIINLLEKFFDMNKKQCREALDIYKKFLIRMDRVAEFLKVAENVGIDKGEIPDLTRAPSSLLEALEQHLQSLEGNKKGTSKGKELHSPGQSAAPGATNGTASEPVNGVKEEAVKKALEEEAAMMSQLKFNLLPAKPVNAPEFSSPFAWKQECWPDLEKHEQDKPYNPFLSSPTSEAMTAAAPAPAAGATNSVDFFDLFGANVDNQANTASSNKASNDLMMLANNSTSNNAAMAQNPFADILSGLSIASTNTATFNGNTSNSAFATNFASAFKNQNATSSVSQGFDAFGDLLQPQKSGDIPVIPQQPAPPPTSMGGIIKGDLDSSLASLAQNLDINTPKGAFKKPGQQQFNPPKTTVLTGGTNWTAGTNWSNMAVAPGMPMVSNQWTGVPTMPGAMTQPYGLPMNMMSGQMATGPMPGMVAPIMSTGMMGAAKPPVSNIFTGSTTSMNNNSFPSSASSFTSDPFGAL